MESLKIVIATGFIFLFSSFLSGCSTSDDSVELTSIRSAAPIQAEQVSSHIQALSKDVELQFKAHQEKDLVHVDLILFNPSAKPITSVQAWLSYDPESLAGVDTDVSESAFKIMAPFANTFDDERGLSMLGRANSEPLTDRFIKVATLTFKRLQPGVTMLHVYDYRSDLSGHTSANRLWHGRPYNVLKTPDSPALILQ